MDQSHQTSNQDNQQVFSLLKSLQKSSKELQKNPIFSSHEPQSTLEPFLDLEKDANLSNDPNLFKLSQLLCNLKSLLEKLQKYQGYSLPCILRRQIINYKIYQLAYAVETEIQGYCDRQSVEKLVETLQGSDYEDEDEKVKVLVEFEKRLSQDFDIHFQDLILKAKVFSILELLLCDSSCSIRIRDQVALVIASMVRFNKDVFVGLVLMGSTVGALISMSSCCSIRVLSLLIKFIRIPLVDELEAHKEIPRIISLLSSEDVSIQVEAVNCILGIAYYGRREAIETMIEAGLVEKLVRLQRFEKQSNEDENGTTNEGDPKMESNQEGYTGNCPFEGCVARFAVQLEAGEMLSKKEKIEFKLEILRRVREVSVSEAEIATIVAEVLWGSYP